MNVKETKKKRLNIEQVNAKMRLRKPLKRFMSQQKLPVLPNCFIERQNVDVTLNNMIIIARTMHMNEY